MALVSLVFFARIMIYPKSISSYLKLERRFKGISLYIVPVNKQSIETLKIFDS